MRCSRWPERIRRSPKSSPSSRKANIARSACPPTTATSIDDGIAATMNSAASDISSPVGVIGRVWSAFRGGDDHLLSGIARILEQDGFRMVGIRDVAPDILMPEGNIARAMPDATATADIARGREVLGALGPFDIGQAVVVIDGHVVAVEDIEGTDGLLARVARLREAGRIRAKSGRGVLVKAPKSSQDLRFDLPAVGAKTIEGVAKAGLAGIAVIAGHTIAADAQAMIEAADKAGLFIQGVPA